MYTHRDLHALAHTARILAVLESNAEHPRSGEYQRQLKIYAGRWAELSAEDRESVIAAAHEIPDMTDEVITTAVATLEA